MNRIITRGLGGSSSEIIKAGFNGSFFEQFVERIIVQGKKTLKKTIELKQNISVKVKLLSVNDQIIDLIGQQGISFDDNNAVRITTSFVKKQISHLISFVIKRIK